MESIVSRGFDPYMEIEKAIRLAADCGLDKQQIRDEVQQTLITIDAEELGFLMGQRERTWA